MNQIVVSFSPNAGITKNQISEFVNRSLDSIKSEVLNWNGFVDLRNTADGNYVLIAKCDNEEIRQKMQELLNQEINRMNDAA
jgi:hypothetical protein